MESSPLSRHFDLRLKELNQQIHSCLKDVRKHLQELEEADLLLHVTDGSHQGVAEHVTAVEQILEELGLSHRPSILVLNKLDREEEPNSLRGLLAQSGGVAISAATGRGIDEMLSRIESLIRPQNVRLSLRIPYTNGTALSLCYQSGRVLRREDLDEEVHLEVDLPRHLTGVLSAYRSRTV